MLQPFHGYYAILDVKGTSADFAALIAHAGRLLAAKPCCLQLRGKNLGLSSLCEVGRAVGALCKESGVPFCINDRLDVALAVAADVLHVGQNDLPLEEIMRVRASARADLRIGVSANHFAQAEAAAGGGADYIGFGPIFSTRSKSDAEAAVGLAALKDVASSVRCPVIAIGGISLENVASVVDAGASGAAVIAAIDHADDPTAAGKTIARAFLR
jgi:thiamine-phosphate pyrophosphorylase